MEFVVAVELHGESCSSTIRMPTSALLVKGLRVYWYNYI